MQSKATNSSRLSAYHFVLKFQMTNAQQITYHILTITNPALCPSAIGDAAQIFPRQGRTQPRSMAHAAKLHPHDEQTLNQWNKENAGE
jgi:hypothetical protein